MNAKLIKKIEHPDKPYYFNVYEFECIDCGAHYTRHSYNRRTNPYCGACARKHESERNKIRKAEQEQRLINGVLEQLRADIDSLELVKPSRFGLPKVYKHEVLDLIDSYMKGASE